MIILRIIIKDITTFKKIANIAKPSLIDLYHSTFVWSMNDRPIFTTRFIIDRIYQILIYLQFF